jgi:hypothetical protein
MYPKSFEIRATRINKLLIFVLITLSSYCNGQVITTIAGTGTSGYNGDGISATTAQIFYPHNLALDAAGNIYFPDYGNARIRKITISTGLISTIAGTGTSGYNGDGITATAALINQPTSIAVDTNGNVYFTDRNNHRVRKITVSTGIISTVAGTGTAGYNGDGIAATAAQLSGPNEVVFDAAGNLFISDWFNQRVRKVDKVTGLISTIAGTGTAGYNGDGIAATTAQIDGPCGIIFDAAGNIYIAAYSGQRIRKITISTGIITTVAGTGIAGFSGDGAAATSAQLNWPAYISFDGSGNMYIGDDNNYRIRKIDAVTGFISTIAGTGTAGYNGDGIAPTTAQLNHAYYPLFNNYNCSMYIVDTYNHRIRKITGGFGSCLPAVAPGNKTICQALPAITIDNTNNNIWVPVYDTAGRIAAEINANGNNLGIVNTSLFTKTGPCREDASFRLYLNRNITITPQTQPISGNVSVRLYILKAELDTLKTAINSQSQPSGVASINDVDVFKNNSACQAIGGPDALPLAATTGNYSSDYYLQVNVSSFSSFYFANKSLTAILPLKLKSFSGKHAGITNQLKWEADCFDDVVFNVERSADAINFPSIGSISAGRSDCNKTFLFTDKNILAGNNFYRLHIVETNGRISYSPLVLLNNNHPLSIRLINNPLTKDALDIELSAETVLPVTLICTDASGRMILQRQVNIHAGDNRISLDMKNTPKGIYILYAVSETGRSNIIRLVK